MHILFCFKSKKKKMYNSLVGLVNFFHIHLLKMGSCRKNINNELSEMPDRKLTELDTSFLECRCEITTTA